MADQAQLYQDRSGTIAVGGAAQELLPAKPSRQGWGFFNNSSAALLVHFAGTASATRGIEVPSKALLEMPEGTSAPKGAVSVYGGTTAQAFTCWEW